MMIRKPINSNLIASIVTVGVLSVLIAVSSLDLVGGAGESSVAFEAMDDETFLDLENLILEDIDFVVKPSPVSIETQTETVSSQPSSSEKGIMPDGATVKATEFTQEDLAMVNPIPVETLKVQKVPLPELKIDSIKAVVEVDSAIADLMSAMKDVHSNSSKSNSDKQMTAKQRLEFYRNNYRLIRNFQKVYPYALKTRQVIEAANIQLATLSKESDKRKLIKQMEDELFAEYEGAIRKMSVSQGKLLLKLIARETNKTGYELIKEYKGAFNASFWYGVGKIFGTDLKTKYNHEEDSLIENVLEKYKQNELY